jgi:hypothetical protein
VLNNSLNNVWTNSSYKSKNNLVDNIETGDVNINDAAQFIRAGYVLDDLQKYFWIVDCFVNNFLAKRLHEDDKKCAASYTEINGNEREVKQLIDMFPRPLKRLSTLLKIINTFFIEVCGAYKHILAGDSSSTLYKKRAPYYIAILLAFLFVTNVIVSGIESVHTVIVYLKGLF